MNTTDRSARRGWLWAFVPLLFWTVLTLGLGSGGASMSETSRFIRPLLEFLFPSADPDTLYLYHAFIRKMAHVFQYGVLGLLTVRAFSQRRLCPFSAIGFIAAVALLDEVNQSFDPARTSTAWDVVLDVASGAAAVLAYRRFFTRRASPASGGSGPTEPV